MSRTAILSVCFVVASSLRSGCPAHAPCKGCNIKPYDDGGSANYQLQLELADEFENYYGSLVLIELDVRSVDGKLSIHEYEVTFTTEKPTVIILDHYPPQASSAYVKMHFTNSDGSTFVASDEVEVLTPTKD